MKKTLIVVMMVLLAAVLIVSCKNNVDSPVMYKVTFDLNGGSGDISSQTVVKDGKATKPADPTPSNANHYVFEFWTKEGETTEFDFANTAITANTTLVAKWKNKYKVGDTGPAGGKIFYVADTEQTSVWGSDSLTWKYLEVATSNASIGSNSGYYTWSPAGVTCSTGTGIGSGWSNMQEIKSKDNYAGTFFAANACATYGASGQFNDWFLPSKDELLELYSQKEQVGGTFSSPYWTSSMSNNGNVYDVNFNSGVSSDADPLTFYKYVRPIRAF